MPSSPTPARHVRALDRSSALPLWAQLEAELRRRLDAGEFADQFPTDMELVDSYDVSRHTVREAIRSLNRQGMLQRQRGRGTVVLSQQVEQPLGVLYSLFRTLESRGITQRSVVARLDQVVDTSAAAAIDLDPRTPLLLLERVRYADDVTLAFDRTFMPYELTSALMTADFTRTALYDELEARCNIRPNRGWEKITSVLPDKKLREHLGIGNREPLLRLERGSYEGATPVEYRLTYIHAENFQLVSEWSEHGAARINAERIRTGPNDAGQRRQD